MLRYYNLISVILMCYCCNFSVYCRCLRCLMCAGIMLCEWRTHLFRCTHLSTWWSVPPHWLPCSKDSWDCSSMNVLLHWYLIKQAAAPKCKKKDKINSRNTNGQMINFLTCKQINPFYNSPRIPQLNMLTETPTQTYTIPTYSLVAFLNLSCTLLSHGLFCSWLIETLTNLPYNLHNLSVFPCIPYAVDRGKRHFCFTSSVLLRLHVYRTGSAFCVHLGNECCFFLFVCLFVWSAWPK